MAESRFIVFVNVTEEVGERGNPHPNDLTIDKVSFTVYGDSEVDALAEALAHLQQHNNRAVARERVHEDSPWSLDKRLRIIAGLKFLGLATSQANDVVDEFTEEVTDKQLGLSVEKLINMIWGWYLHAANQRMHADAKVLAGAEDEPTGALRAQDQAEIQETDELMTHVKPLAPSQKFGSVPLTKDLPGYVMPDSVREELSKANETWLPAVESPGTYDFRSAVAKADDTQPIPVQAASEQGPSDVTIDGSKGFYEPTGNWPKDKPEAPAEDLTEPISGGG